MLVQEYLSAKISKHRTTSSSFKLISLYSLIGFVAASDLNPIWEVSDFAQDLWDNPSLTSPRGFKTESSDTWTQANFEITADFTNIAPLVRVDEVLMAKRGDLDGSVQFLNSVKIRYKDAQSQWIELGEFDTGFVPSDDRYEINTVATPGVVCSEMMIYFDSSMAYNNDLHPAGRIGFTGQAQSGGFTLSGIDLEPDFDLTSYCCSSWTNPAFSNTNGFASALHDFSTGPYEITADFSNISPLVRVDELKMKKSGYGSSYEDRYITSFKLKYKNQFGSWIELGLYDTGFTDSDDMNFVRVVARPGVVCSEMIIYLDDRSMFVDGNGQDYILMRIGFTGQVVTGGGSELLPEWEFTNVAGSTWADPSLTSPRGFSSASTHDWSTPYEITADFTDIATFVRIDEIMIAKRGDGWSDEYFINSVKIRYKNQFNSWIELGEFYTGFVPSDDVDVIKTVATPGVTCSQMILYLDSTSMFEDGNRQKYATGRIAFTGEAVSVGIELEPDFDLTSYCCSSWTNPAFSNTNGFASALHDFSTGPYEITADFTNISPLVRVDQVKMKKSGWGAGYEDRYITGFKLKYKNQLGSWIELGQYDTGFTDSDDMNFVRVVARPGVVCSEMIIYLDDRSMFVDGDGQDYILMRIGFTGEIFSAGSVELEPEFELTSYCCGSWTNPAFSSVNGFASAEHDFSTGPYEITADFTNIAPLVRVDEVMMKKSGWGSGYEDRYITSFKLKYKNQQNQMIELGLFNTGFTDTDDMNFVRIVARPGVVCSEMIIYLDDRSMFVDGDGQDYILMRIGFTGEMITSNVVSSGIELLPEWDLSHDSTDSSWEDPSLSSNYGFGSDSRYWDGYYEITADFTNLAPLVRVDQVQIAKRADVQTARTIDRVFIKYKNPAGLWVELGEFFTGQTSEDARTVVRTIAYPGVTCSEMVVYFDRSMLSFPGGNNYCQGRLGFIGEVIPVSSVDLNPEWEVTNSISDSWLDPSLSSSHGFGSSIQTWDPYFEIRATFTNISPLVRVDEVLLSKNGQNFELTKLIYSVFIKYKDEYGQWVELGEFDTGQLTEDPYDLVRTIATPGVTCSEMVIYLDSSMVYLPSGWNNVLGRVGFRGQEIHNASVDQEVQSCDQNSPQLSILQADLAQCEYEMEECMTARSDAEAEILQCSQDLEAASQETTSSNEARAQCETGLQETQEELNESETARTMCEISLETGQEQLANAQQAKADCDWALQLAQDDSETATTQCAADLEAQQFELSDSQSAMAECQADLAMAQEEKLQCEANLSTVSQMLDLNAAHGQDLAHSEQQLQQCIFRETTCYQNEERCQANSTQWWMLYQNATADVQRQAYELIAAQVEITQLRTNVSGCEAEIRRVEQQASAQVDSFENATQQQIAQLVQDAALARAEAKSTRGQFISFQAEIASLQLQLNSTNIALANAESRNQQLESQLESSLNDTLLVQQLEASRAEVARLNTTDAENARLQGELQNSESRIQALETQLTISQSNLTVTESRNEALDTSLNEMTEQFTTCEANNANLNSLLYYRSTILAERRGELMDEFISTTNQTRASEILLDIAEIVREEAVNDEYTAEAESQHQQQQQLIATITTNSERCGNDLNICQVTAQTTQEHLNEVTEQNVALTDQIVEQTSVTSAEIQRLSGKVEETQAELQDMYTLYSQVDSLREQCGVDLTDTESQRSQCEVQLANCTEFVESREASGFNPFNCNRGSSQSPTTNFAEEAERQSQQAMIRSELGDALGTEQTIAQDGKLSDRLLLIIIAIALMVVSFCVGRYICRTDNHPAAKVTVPDVEASQVQMCTNSGEPDAVDSNNTVGKRDDGIALASESQNSSKQIVGRE